MALLVLLISERQRRVVEARCAARAATAAAAVASVNGAAVRASSRKVWRAEAEVPSAPKTESGAALSGPPSPKSMTTTRWVRRPRGQPLCDGAGHSHSSHWKVRSVSEGSWPRRQRLRPTVPGDSHTTSVVNRPALAAPQSAAIPASLTNQPEIEGGGQMWPGVQDCAHVLRLHSQQIRRTLQRQGCQLGASADECTDLGCLRRSVGQLASYVSVGERHDTCVSSGTAAGKRSAAPAPGAQFPCNYRWVRA